MLIRSTLNSSPVIEFANATQLSHSLKRTTQSRHLGSATTTVPKSEAARRERWLGDAIATYDFYDGCRLSGAFGDALRFRVMDSLRGFFEACGEL